MPTTSHLAARFSHILIASADLAAMELLNRQLPEWNYAADAVSEGTEVLRRLLEGSLPQIAILDTELVGVSGFEVASAVKARRVSQPVWIILLCDHANAAMVAEARDAGVDDLVLKPLDATDLRIRLNVAERMLALMTELNAQTHAARFYSEHDPLTGLWNRKAMLRLLAVELDRVQRKNAPLAVVLLDIDRFSQINQDYGYEAGDGILQELARRFRRYLRSYDLIGRCGEDEFLIALSDCTAEQALVLSRRVKRGLLLRPFVAGKDLLNITVSTGIAQGEGCSALALLGRAEKALVLAKRSGRNCERTSSELAAPTPMNLNEPSDRLAL